MHSSPPNSGGNSPFRRAEEFTEGTFRWGVQRIEEAKFGEWRQNPETFAEVCEVFSPIGILRVLRNPKDDKENDPQTLYVIAESPNSVRGTLYCFHYNDHTDLSDNNSDWLKKIYGITVEELLKNLSPMPPFKEGKTIANANDREETLKKILDPVIAKSKTWVICTTGITKNGICTIANSRTPDEPKDITIPIRVNLPAHNLKFELAENMRGILEVYIGNSRVHMEKMSQFTHLLDEALETFTPVEGTISPINQPAEKTGHVQTIISSAKAAKNKVSRWFK